MDGQIAVWGMPIFGGIVTIIGSLVGVWAYRKRKKIDINAAAQKAKIKASTTPLEVLTAAIERRDAILEKRDALITEMAKAYLNHNSSERKALLESLISISGTLQTLAEDVKDGREDSRRRAGDAFKKLDAIKDDVKIIKDRLPRKLE